MKAIFKESKEFSSKETFDQDKSLDEDEGPDAIKILEVPMTDPKADLMCTENVIAINVSI